MYADVIPLLRMPRTTSTFTYRIPSNLEGMLVVGQCVRVPWRGRTVTAVVHSLSQEKPTRRISEIESVVESIPSWNQAVVSAIMQHAAAIFSSPASLAQGLFPDVPVRKSTAERAGASMAAADDAALSTPVELTIAKRDVEGIKAAINAANEHGDFLAHSQSERLLAIQSWAKQASGQVLVLTPTLYDAKELARFLRASLKESVLVWGGVESKGKRWQRWQNVRDGKHRLVVATRSGAAVPLKQLSLVIVDQSDDQDHRSWESAPHYDAAAFAAALCKHAQIPCRRVAFFPAIQARRTWVEAPTTWPAMTMIMHNRMTPLIAEPLLEDMEAALEQGGHILIICTQRAAASAYVCLDCHYRWLCETCRMPLQEREHVLRCHHCQATQPLPTECLKCHGQQLRGFAAGAEALASDLPKQLHALATIFTANDDVNDIIKLEKPTIILSTPFTWRRFAGRTKRAIGLTVFFQPERMLFAPDYRANEWYLRTLAWHRIMVQAYLRQPLIVQSGLNDQQPMAAFTLLMPHLAWHDQESKSRQQLGLPPFGRTLLCILEDASESEPIDKALRQDLPQAVFGPRHAHGKTTWFIKIPATNQGNLDKLNNSVYSKVLISPEPETAF